MIQSGDRVSVLTANGTWLARRAVSAAIQGYKFPVIYVCSEANWALALEYEHPVDAAAWPADDVTLLPTPPGGDMPGGDQDPASPGGVRD